jgi:hypothetical protein
MTNLSLLGTSTTLALIVPPASPSGDAKIDDPASTDMLPRLPAVAQNIGIGAAGLFKSIGQDRQPVEGSVRVDGRCQIHDAPVSVAA